MKRIGKIIIMMLVVITRGMAQTPAPQVFTIDSFITQVKKYHPLAAQADLQVDKALAELMAAKGAFDPALEFDASRKTFDGKNYYYYTNPQLTVPLPIGNLNTGVENNGGSNLTTEVTKGRSSYAGVEVPLAKGLLLDKRRAVLQQAKILRTQSEQERLLLYNNLLYDAYINYWQWAASYQQFMAYTTFTKVAGNRMRLVRIAFTNGDRSMADTIEAYTQLQNYQLLQAEALLKLNLARFELSDDLWQKDYRPYQLPDHFIPDSLRFINNSPFKNVDDLLALSASQNPLLQVYNFKLTSLDVERRLKYQSLLPYVALKANLLTKDYYALKNLSTNFIQNNYKWGIAFKLPLFLREARGDYKKAQLKIKETTLELVSKRQQTENKIRSYFTTYYSIFSQLQTTQNMYDNYVYLLRTEELKFAQGESALFFVNSRETKVIEILQKQIELTLKFYKAKYAMEWAAGLLK